MKRQLESLDEPEFKYKKHSEQVINEYLLTDVITSVFYFLDGQELLKFRSVCKSWKHYLRNLHVGFLGIVNCFESPKYIKNSIMDFDCSESVIHIDSREGDSKGYHDLTSFINGSEWSNGPVLISGDVNGKKIVESDEDILLMCANYLLLVGTSWNFNYYRDKKCKKIPKHLEKLDIVATEISFREEDSLWSFQDIIQPTISNFRLMKLHDGSIESHNKFSIQYINKITQKIERTGLSINDVYDNMSNVELSHNNLFLGVYEIKENVKFAYINCSTFLYVADVSYLLKQLFLNNFEHIVLEVMDNKTIQSLLEIEHDFTSFIIEIIDPRTYLSHMHNLQFEKMIVLLSCDDYDARFIGDFRYFLSKTKTKDIVIINGFCTKFIQEEINDIVESWTRTDVKITLL